LGSFLCNTNELEMWEGALSKLKSGQSFTGGNDNEDLWSVLKISYDPLDKQLQNMFLDIACFLGGLKLSTICRMWNRDEHPYVALRNLQHRSLLEWAEGGILYIHDQLRNMGPTARAGVFDQLLAQGQVVAQGIFAQLQQQVLNFVQQAVGQLSSLVGSIGGRFDFASLFDQFKPLLEQFANQALAQVLGGLSGLIGGRAGIDLGAIFNDFLASVTPAITGLGQHFLNQGLAAVLGGLGNLGGSRAIGDIFASLSAQVSAAVTAAQGALGGALSGLSALGSQILDASKPHWEQLQEQLVGHGLNVLGSIAESINNAHGSIVGGR
jgi:hypothetical protein